jgi:hypothetical protein
MSTTNERDEGEHTLPLPSGGVGTEFSPPQVVDEGNGKRQASTMNGEDTSHHVSKTQRMDDQDGNLNMLKRDSLDEQDDDIKDALSYWFDIEFSEPVGGDNNNVVTPQYNLDKEEEALDQTDATSETEARDDGKDIDVLEIKGLEEATKLLERVKPENPIYLCRKCGKELPNVQKELSNLKPGLVDFTVPYDRDKHHNLAQCFLLDAVYTCGHSPEWNFLPKTGDNLVKTWINSGIEDLNDLLTNQVLSSQSSNLVFTEFENQVRPWPPDSPSPLHCYIDYCCGWLLGSIDSGLPNGFKKVHDCITAKLKIKIDTTKWKEVYAPAVRSKTRKHIEAIHRAIDDNWYTIKNMTVELVYRFIQDVFASADFSSTNLYKPEGELPTSTSSMTRAVTNPPFSPDAPIKTPTTNPFLSTFKR